MVVRWIVYLALIISVIAAVAIASPHIVEWQRSRFFLPSDSVPGEVFAGVNAFFSAIAFGVLILTVLLQAYELSLQRRELADTREVLNEQAETLALQQFDNTFFNLLSLHNEIVRGSVLTGRSVSRLQSNRGPIEAEGESVRFEGREVFRALLDSLLVEVDRLMDEHPDWTAQQRFSHAYERVYSRYRDLLGHYFRNLCHIVKLVEVSSIPERKRYTNFIRAQLAGSELQLLFHNCRSEWGRGFYPLVVSYSMLEHLPVGEAVPTELLLEYPEDAYGGNPALLHHYRQVTREQSDQNPA